MFVVKKRVVCKVFFDKLIFIHVAVENHVVLLVQYCTEAVDVVLFKVRGFEPRLLRLYVFTAFAVERSFRKIAGGDHVAEDVKKVGM